MTESFQKNPTATMSENASTNDSINRADSTVALTALPSSSTCKDSNDKSTKVNEDLRSERANFGWEKIGTSNLPYIRRIINGETSNYVAVRIAENQLLKKYLDILHADIYSCTSVNSHFMSEDEAKILNDININHSDQLYGKEQFQPGKDYIVNLEDVKELYAFLIFCYEKLLCNVAPGGKEKCGFICINSESVVPYYIKDNQKYVPLFYFQGETDNLRHRAIKLENWDLAYLKFCCKVQGITHGLFASNSCTVISLDDIKNYFPSDTNYDDYWPAHIVDRQVRTNTKNTTISTPGSWIRVPHPYEIPHALEASTPPGPLPSMPI